MAKTVGAPEFTGSNLDIRKAIRLLTQDKYSHPISVYMEHHTVENKQLSST